MGAHDAPEKIIEWMRNRETTHFFDIIYGYHFLAIAIQCICIHELTLYIVAFIPVLNSNFPTKQRMYEMQCHGVSFYLIANSPVDICHCF